MGYYQPDEGEHPGRRPRAGDRQSARRACARPRHGLSALHAGAGHDRRGEPGAGARAQAARGHRLARASARRSKTFLARMPFRVPLDAKVSAISAGERQKCEILKQLYLQRRFLILDEPTSVLTPGRGRRGARHAARHGRRGDLTVLMITHKFREVMAFADEVTILRRGKLAGDGQVSDLTPDAMARMMIGAEELTVQPRAHRRVRRAAARHRQASMRSTMPASRRCATSRSRSAAARSSASPASPATASASWSRCSPASARPSGGEIASARRALSRHPRGDARGTSSPACRRSR